MFKHICIILFIFLILTWFLGNSPVEPIIIKESFECKSETKDCDNKYISAFKATGCSAKPDPAIINWWREKNDKSEIWKDMLNRCQKSLKGGDENANMACCGTKDCKPNSCSFLKEWVDDCSAAVPSNNSSCKDSPAPILPVKNTVDVLKTPVCPRKDPLMPNFIPEPKDCKAPLEIPGHKHSEHHPEQAEILTNIRKVMGQLKERMNIDNFKRKGVSMNPQHYSAWEKVAKALKIPEKDGAKPQQLGVHVDVTDSRELHYEVPGGGPAAIQKAHMAPAQLKGILNQLDLPPKMKNKVGIALDKFDSKKKSEKVDKRTAMAALRKDPTAKFNALKEKKIFAPYAASNEDEYGDINLNNLSDKEKKKIEKGLYGLGSL